MTNLIAHALREFKAAGYEPIDGSEDGPDKWIQENVLELLELFSSQGHSGLSAGYCVSMLEKLARFEPLVPLQGVEDEWGEPFNGDDGTRQNKRCSHVFQRKDGTAYDINGRVFREKNGACYTSRDSHVDIVFPYIPTTVYVDVEEEAL